MTAIKDRAIGYINEMPEEKVHSLIEIIRYLAEEKHPLEVLSKREHIPLKERLEGFCGEYEFEEWDTGANVGIEVST